MTREEQIKAAAKKTTGLFSYRNGYSTAEDAFIAGAKWADANQPNPWISVENGLPELNNYGESKMVFVRVINKDTKAEWIEQPAKYNVNINDWIAMDFTHIGKRNGIVTHWMEIPQIKEDIK